MAKTLIIKSADFSANKLDTVTIEQNIPCTGISLDQSTKSLTSLTAFTLVATKTPSNTTDAVSWGTSDATVATVADGVVTPVGLGTVIITATCGNYSATCTVTIDNVVPDFVAVAGYSPFRRQGGLPAMTTDKKTGEAGKFVIIAANQATGLYPIESKTDVDTSPYRFVPILIPSGATKIIIDTDIGKLKTRTYFLNSTLEETNFNTGGAYCVYGTTGTNDQDSTIDGPIEISIPDDISGLDSCCFAITVTVNQTYFTDITSHFTFKYSYGE